MWNISKLVLILCVAVLTATLAPHALRGDDTDAPSPLKKKKPPQTGADAEASQMTIPQDTIDAFKEAYDKDDSPKMIVLVGMDRSIQLEGLANQQARQGTDRSSNKTVITSNGTVVDKSQQSNINSQYGQALEQQKANRGDQSGLLGAGGGGMGADLSLYDSSGVTSVLRGQLDGNLAKYDADTIDPTAMNDLDKRDVTLLSQNDEDGAVRLLGTKLNADVVMYVKLTPTNADAPAGRQKDPRGNFAVEIKFTDMRSGRVLAGDGFYWTGPLDGERTRVYAATISSILMQGYADKIGNATSTKFQMRIVGLTDSRQAAEIARTIRDVKGVKGKIRNDFTKGDDSSYTDLTIGYRGSSSDLVMDVQDAVKQNLQIDLNGLDIQARRITLTAVPVGAPAEAAPGYPWIPLIDPSTPDPNNLRDDFQKSYEQKGRPSVAIVINWLLRPEQTRTVDFVKVDKIGAGDDPQFNRNEIGSNTIGLQTMEDELSKVFKGAKFKVFSATDVRRIARAQAEQDSTKPLDEEHLAALLKNTQGYDILVYGLANVNDAIEKDSNGQPGSTESNTTGIEYDFKVDDVRSGEFIGSQKWDGEELKSTKKFVKNPGDATEVAHYLGGQLVWQIYQNRLKDATEMSVIVKNVESDRTVDTLSEAIKTNVDEVTSTANQSFHNGEGRFTIRYTGSFEDFKKKLLAELQRLPVEMNETETSASTLILQTKAGLNKSG